MPTAWRIVKEKHGSTAFSGDGAARVGGRWNSRGVAVVYTSGTKSLAALEVLVHLNPLVPLRFVAQQVEFDAALLETWPLDRLPSDWRREPPGSSTQGIGDGWVRASRSAVLEVPSILVSGESNFLINPVHPDFSKIRLSPPEPFAFDPRLLQR